MAGTRTPGAAGAPEGAPEISYDFRVEIPEEFVPLPATGDGDAAWAGALGTLLPGLGGEGLGGEGLGEAAAALRTTIARHTPATTLRTAVCLGADRPAAAGDRTGDADGGRDGAGEAAGAADGADGKNGAADGTDDGKNGADVAREPDAADVSVAILTVSVQHSGHDSAVVTAEALYRSCQERFFDGEATRPVPIDTPRAKGLRGEQDTLLAVRLPCGPGVSSTSLRSMTLPRPAAAQGGETGTPAEPFRLPVAILQLIVPAPEDYCVYLTLLTPMLTHLAAYSAQMSFMARSLAFDTAARQAEQPG